MKDINKYRSYADVPEIAEIVRKHQLWLKNHRKFRGYRADFRSVNLRGIKFDGITEKYKPNPYYGLNLIRNRIEKSDMLLDLRFADFRGCDLSETAFSCVNLIDSVFAGANIVGTVFHNCELKIVSVGDNNAAVYLPLYINNLRERFECVNLNGQKYVLVGKAQKEIAGEFIGYKYIITARGGAIATLSIPEEAERIVFENDKCRASKVKVLDIVDSKGNHYDEGESWVNDAPWRAGSKPTFYKVGEETCADSFDVNPGIECGHGIHFFLTEQEAWDYVLAFL